MRRKETFQELNLNNAFMFALAMNDPDICRMVLELILGEPVGDIRVRSEQTLLYNSDFRSVRLDVYAQNELYVDYDVEMQNSKENLPKRSRFYQAQMDVAALKPGEDFDQMQPCYVIFICTYDPFGKQLYRYSYENICHETGESLGDGTKKIFLSTKGRNICDVSPKLIHFLQYVEHSTDECVSELKDHTVADIHRRIAVLKASHEWEARYMKFEELLKEERREGEQDGLQQGVEQGIEQGIQRGEARMTRLLQELLRLGRNEDISRLADDPQLKERLYQEFHI